MWVKAECSPLLRDQSTALGSRPLLAPSVLSRPCLKSWGMGTSTNGGLVLIQFTLLSSDDSPFLVCWRLLDV